MLNHEIEQRIMEKGTPSDLERYRKVHVNDGEPVSKLTQIHLAMYKGHLMSNCGVDEDSATKIVSQIEARCSNSEPETNRLANLIKNLVSSVSESRRESVKVPSESEETVIFKK